MKNRRLIFNSRACLACPLDAGSIAATVTEVIWANVPEAGTSAMSARKRNFFNF